MLDFLADYWSLLWRLLLVTGVVIAIFIGGELVMSLAGDLVGMIAALLMLLLTIPLLVVGVFR